MSGQQEGRLRLFSVLGYVLQGLTYRDRQVSRSGRLITTLAIRPRTLGQILLVYQPEAKGERFPVRTGKLRRCRPLPPAPILRNRSEILPTRTDYI